LLFLQTGPTCNRYVPESTFDYFDCVKSGDGKFYMRGDPAMECWNYTDKVGGLYN
jgi:hypothetical protein